MNYFTADSHFSKFDESVISRDFRPFENLEEMNEKIIEIWNSQAGENDVIYHLGDFVNFNKKDTEYDSLLKMVQKINAKVVLILGNNEKRILDYEFDGNFEEFRKYLISCGFLDVVKDKMNLKIGDNEFCLTHCPVDANKETIYNLFGHIHKCSFVKKYGFNIGVDNHYFKLFSEDDVLELYTRLKFYDENVYN
jgi:calcineurin-like phosphoesterase family protein